MHVNFRQPYGSIPRFANKQPLSSIRMRLYLYGAVGALVVATSLWSIQQAKAIAADAQQNIQTEQVSLASQRSAAIQAWTVNATELLRRGATLVQAGQQDIAIQVLQEAAKRDPRSRDVQLQLAYAYIQSNQLESAKGVLETAKAIDPIYPVTFELLATVYAKTGDIQAATTAAARAQQFALITKLPDLATK